MCGIEGTLNGNLGQGALDIIGHRGPDSQGTYKWNNLNFGHVRLSIVDLSEAGSQPMHSDCGNYTIIFNGEIYNHEDLRAELKGISFKGHSDTETLLYYLRERGIQGVKKFNGIFSLAFLDKKTNQVYLARDPFGVKPMYYFEENGLFSGFSSEIRGLEQLGAKKELDWQTITTFLRLRYYPSPLTPFKNIKKLAPGTIMQIDVGEKTIQSITNFYSIPKINRNIQVSEALEEYDFLLKRAVKRQLMSDVPISLLLSGGVDSALLAKLVTDMSSEKVQTYTAGYEGNYKNIDEIDDAQYTANYLGIPNKKIILNEKSFIEELPRLIGQIEEPLGSQSIFPIHFLSKSISEDGFKVALTGQGVDEPWGGYKRYNAQEALEVLTKIPIPYKRVGNVVRKDSLRRAIKALGTSDRASRFMESYSLFDDDMISRLLKMESFSFHGAKFTSDLIESRKVEMGLEGRSATSSMMVLDARMNLADDLLLYTDKISMMHSIEMRVPFLDIELMHFVEGLPHTMKVGLFKNKWLHKKLAEKHLPKEIIYRKKKGFYTPRKEWFKGRTGKDLQQQINENKGLFSEIFNVQEINTYFELHRKGKVNYEKQLYLLIVFFLCVQEQFE